MSFNISKNGIDHSRIIINWCFLFLLLIFILTSCATPQVEQLSRTQILQPDEEDNLGGTFFESGDIRTIATKMSAALLSTPEISKHPEIVRIALAPIRNNTRFVIDNEIFINRLRVELNKTSSGKIRFFSQTTDQRTRKKIIQEQDEEYWDELINQVADHIVNASFFQSAKQPPTIAVIPIRNTNFVDLNADSLTALIRSKIAEKSKGRIYFLSREKNGKVIEEILDEKDIKDMGLVKTRHLKNLYGADYFLGGEFIAKSLTIEGSTKGVHNEANVDKFVNIWLIDAGTGTIPLEKLIKIERKMMSGLGKSNYILTGELMGLSKATVGGARSDYLMLSFQLVNPITNEVLWEDAYETKKKSSTGTVYR